MYDYIHAVRTIQCRRQRPLRNAHEHNMQGSCLQHTQGGVQCETLIVAAELRRSHESNEVNQTRHDLLVKFLPNKQPSNKAVRTNDDHDDAMTFD
jgi:hypothetical protein